MQLVIIASRDQQLVPTTRTQTVNKHSRTSVGLPWSLLQYFNIKYANWLDYLLYESLFFSVP